MLEHYNLILLFLGLAFLIGAFFPVLPRKLSISLPMIQITFGALLGYFFMGLPRINPLNYGVPIEKVTEVVVLISLVGCGIKLDSPLNWKTWQPTLRLLVIVMPVGIAAMALMGHYIFGYGALYFWLKYGGGYFARCGASANRPCISGKHPSRSTQLRTTRRCDPIYPHL